MLIWGIGVTSVSSLTQCFVSILLFHSEYTLLQFLITLFFSLISGIIIGKMGWKRNEGLYAKHYNKAPYK